MSIRFPDLQVLVPRSSEPRAFGATEQNHAALLHQQGMAIAQEREKRNRSVAEAERSEGAEIRDRPRKRGRRGRDSNDPSGRRRGGAPNGEAGQRIDIQA